MCKTRVCVGPWPFVYQLMGRAVNRRFLVGHGHLLVTSNTMGKTRISG